MSTSTTDRSPNVALSNQGFISDELQPPPPYSSIYPFQNESSTDYQSSLKIYSITTTSEAIQINTSLNNTMPSSMEPISYEELFQTRVENVNNNRVETAIDCQYNSTNSQALLLTQNQIITNNISKQIRIQFKPSYLITHFLFIILNSLALITFQIVLMTNNARLSFLGCGIWAGLINLAILIVSIATSKLFLLFIMNHCRYLRLLVFIILT